MKRIEAPFGRTGSDRFPRAHRGLGPLEADGAQVFELEKVADEPTRAFGDDHGAGLGDVK